MLLKIDFFTKLLAYLGYAGCSKRFLPIWRETALIVVPVFAIFAEALNFGILLTFYSVTVRTMS